MSHWLFLQCPYYLSGPWMFQLRCCLCRVRKLNLSSEDEQWSYRFGTTWGWVINYRIFHFVWTFPLNNGEWRFKAYVILRQDIYLSVCVYRPMNSSQSVVEMKQELMCSEEPQVESLSADLSTEESDGENREDFAHLPASTLHPKPLGVSIFLHIKM